MILEVLKHPDERLRLVSTPVDPDEIHTYSSWLPDFVETMEKLDGIGLAAPQVNVQKQIIVLLIAGLPVVMFNPEVTVVGDDTDLMEEGCLSVPDQTGAVQRPTKIQVKYLTRRGKEAQMTLEGLEARCLQHEVDHLNGVLFVDKVLNDS